MDTVTEVVQKKPRTEAQMTALENARRKALQMRAQKTALKKQEEADKATAVVEAQTGVGGAHSAQRVEPAALFVVAHENRK